MKHTLMAQSSNRNHSMGMMLCSRFLRTRCSPLGDAGQSVAAKAAEEFLESRGSNAPQAARKAVDVPGGVHDAIPGSVASHQAIIVLFEA
jgi:hypothetical protein